MSAAAQQFMRGALAPSTRSSYQTALNNYMRWRGSHHLNSILQDTTPHDVSEWLTHLALHQRRSSTTIDVYRAALRTMLIEEQGLSGAVNTGTEAASCNPCDHVTVMRVLKGIKRKGARTESMQRAEQSATPLTVAMIRSIYAAGVVTTLSDQRSFAALTLGVCAFLRPGEFVGKQPITWSQLMFYREDGTQTLVGTPDYFTLRLHTSKTDQMGRGRVIHVATAVSVQAMWVWYQSRPLTSSPLTPVFLNVAGVCLSLPRLLATISVWLCRAGYPSPALRIRGRSFRRGGASSMAAAGESAATIQRAGRWASDAATLYIGHQAAVTRTIEASRRL